MSTATVEPQFVVMRWKPVTKNVRGNCYLYLQHSYREEGRKNPSTLNIYCGRADDSTAWTWVGDFLAFVRVVERYIALGGDPSLMDSRVRALVR